MAFIFYLAYPQCGLLAGCSRLHSTRDFPFEIDHNSEVWSGALSEVLGYVIKYFQFYWKGVGFNYIQATKHATDKNVSMQNVFYFPPF